MKKLTFIFFSGILLFSFTACDDRNEGKIESDEPKESIIRENKEVDSTRYDNPGNENDSLKNNLTAPIHDYDDTVTNNKKRKNK